MANTRRCPFYNCEKMIDPSLFACRHHWPMMEDGDRTVIWQIYSDYLKGELHIDELVRQQGEIMLKNTPQIVPGAARAGPGNDAVSLAKMVSRYIAKRKEYSAVKDQMLDKKRQVGIALGKIEKELSNAVAAILHPEQTQPTLFDPDNKQDNNLPD